MADGQQAPHTLTLDERRKLTVTGVSEVVSFDEDAIILQTSFGRLTVYGQNLQLKQLTPAGGNVAVEGQVDSLSYEDQQPAGSWFRRLFE